MSDTYSVIRKALYAFDKEQNGGRCTCNNCSAMHDSYMTELDAAAKKLESDLIALTVTEPAPVSATEPEAIEALRVVATQVSADDDTDVGLTFKAACEIHDYITTLRARVAELERVTEDAGAMAIYGNGYGSLDGKFVWANESPECREHYRVLAQRALTAARGGG